MSLAICVLGLGYIGLPTAAILAAHNNNVIGVDVDPEVVETINNGKIHIIEPDLDILVHTVVADGYLRASLTPQKADVFIIAVPTPLTEDKCPDLSFVESAVISCAPFLKQGDLVILESTSPVGTTEKLAKLFSELRPDLRFPPHNNQDVSLAYCPERVMPGKILRELVANTRIIGGISFSCSAKAVSFYNLFVVGECIITDARTAEMCKLTENSFRDVNIAFANELSMLCDELDIDVWELIGLANRHPRVNILQPGPGVGGHCIAVDPWFIVSSVKTAKLITTARQINDYKPNWVMSKFYAELAKFLQITADKSAKDVTVVCLGLTFKPDVDDLRESPALRIVVSLAESHNGPLFIVEPNINELPANIKNSTKLVDLDSALAEADIILALVGHKLFREISLAKWNQYLMIDLCGLKEVQA